MSASDPPTRTRPPEGHDTPGGLCDTCAYQRLIRNTRGSGFSMCGRSRDDPRYPRYPRLPVRICDGYEERPEAEAAQEGPR